MSHNAQLTQVELLQTIIDHSDDGIVVVDEQGLILEWNQKQAAITGVSRDAAIGRAIWDVQMQLAPPDKATPEHRAAARNFTLRLLQTGQSLHGPESAAQTIRRGDGTERIIQTQSVPVPTERGFMLVGTVRDVTELKQLETALRRSEARYRALFEQANDAILLENEQDEIIDANQRAAELLGYTRAELLTLHVSDLQAPEVRGEAGQIVTDELTRYNGRPFESIDLRRDGSRLSVEVTETRLSGLDVGLVLSIVRDISARKRIEQALLENEERFRRAFQSAAIGKALVATDGRFVRVNAALCQMLAYTEEELLARTFSQITHPEDVSLGENYFRRVLAGELDSVSFEKRYLRKDGQPIWVIVSSSLIRAADRQPALFISEMQDITERKRAELALRDSEEKYRQLFELESDAIFLIDNVTGQIYEANSAATVLYGYTHDELLTLRNVDLSAEPDQTRQAMAEHHELIPIRWHRRRDGSIFPVEITARHLVWHDRPVHVAAIRDITERERVQQALRASEQRYRALVEISPDAIVLTDLNGVIQLCNNRTAELAGLSDAGELIGRSVLTLVMPEDHERVIANFLRVRADGHMHNVEYQGRDVSGRVVPLEISGTLLTDDRQQPVAVVSVVRDITARKQAEQALVERNRELAELNAELHTRNDDLDAFAHTVAHDLKNPLHLVVGFAETLAEAGGELTPEEQTVVLGNVARNARKMNNIIDELLLLAEVRKTQVVSRPLDLSRILGDALQRLTDMITDAHAEIVLPTTWPVVMGHAPWVEEVWVNYISNAVKYGGQPPRVELGADILADGAVRLWVADNGAGLPPDVHARLFTPFSRLDQIRARGHGLGLSIVRRIVEKMGGQVGVQSGEPGTVGCRFYFTLSQVD